MPIILKHIVICDRCQRESAALFTSTNVDVPAAREIAKDQGWTVTRFGNRYLFLCPVCQKEAKEVG